MKEILTKICVLSKSLIFNISFQFRHFPVACFFSKILLHSSVSADFIDFTRDVLPSL